MVTGFKMMDGKLEGINAICKYGGFSIATAMGFINEGMEAERDHRGIWISTRRKIDKWLKARFPDGRPEPEETKKRGMKPRPKKKKSATRTRW